MDRQVAVFIDYENIYWSMKRQYNFVPDPGRLIDTLRQFAAKYGYVCLMHAYADFDNEEFHGLLSELQRRSVEPRHVFSKNYEDGTRKNAADIEMSLDALELMYHRQDIDIFVLVCGDRDMIQVARKLRARGKSVYVAAVEKAMSKDLIAFANGFETIENLMGVQAPPPVSVETIVRRLQGMEAAMPFVGLKYFMKILSGGEHSDPRVYDLVNRCIAEGLLTTFHVTNPYDDRFPTTACRLNHSHPTVASIIGSSPSEPMTNGQAAEAGQVTEAAATAGKHDVAPSRAAAPVPAPLESPPLRGLTPASGTVQAGT